MVVKHVDSPQKTWRFCTLSAFVCWAGNQNSSSSPPAQVFVRFCSLQISAGCPLLHHQLCLWRCSSVNSRGLWFYTAGLCCKWAYLYLSDIGGQTKTDHVHQILPWRNARQQHKQGRASLDLCSPLFYPTVPPSPDQKTSDLHDCGWIEGTGQSDTSCQDTLSTVASVLFTRRAAFSSMDDHFSMQDEPAWVGSGEFLVLMLGTKEGVGGVFQLESLFNYTQFTGQSKAWWWKF